MESFTSKLRQALDQLTGKQKMQLVVAAVVTLGLIWGMTMVANRVRYGVLFANLAHDDAGPVMAALKEKQVPYRLAAGGTMIEVPVERIDEVRLELAGDGLPLGGGVGFELFDKPAFGLSDFVQNVNYRRALESELARTIQSLRVVDAARVHLALPPKTVFAEEQQRPSASVVVRLSSGHGLPGDRLRAISHLVASGVEGLDPDDVSVVDGDGRLLTRGGDDEERLSSTQLEAKAAAEHQIETTLLSILEPLVGAGRVRARATVELNMTRVNRVQEAFDPNAVVVRSEQKSKNRSEAGGATGGIPGSASNLPGQPSAAAPANSGKQESTNSLTNFEINKIVSTISEPAGALVQQSVAVVVDHAYPETTAADGTVSRTPTPRTQAEMQQITQVVQAAIGFDVERGDQLIVENFPFDDSTSVTETGSGVSVLDLVIRIARYASLPLAVLLLAMLVIRPAIAAIRGLRDQTAGTDSRRPPTVAELQAQVQGQFSDGAAMGLAAEGGSTLRRKLMEAVGEDPQAAALVIRNWLDRREQDR